MEMAISILNETLNLGNDCLLVTATALGEMFITELVEDGAA